MTDAPEAPPTFHEVMRVRRWECRRHGHTWAEVRVWGSDIPVSFVCSNCGEALSVMRRDEDAL